MRDMSKPNPSSTLTRYELGRLGEKIAFHHLQRLGWHIEAQNWRCPLGEIDLIARTPDDTLVFVEVRTRRGRRGLQMARESIDQRKRDRLSALIETYCTTHELPETTRSRLDMIVVTIDRQGLFQVETETDVLGW
jgi:putative endonuclease